MPEIEESRKSIEAIKKILGFNNPREKSRMTQRNAEIALLLKDYKDLMSSNAFDDYKGEYEKLADRAKALDSKAQGAKEEALDIAAKLRLLKKKVRLAAAEKDPTATTKVKEELLRSLAQEPFYREKRERAIAAQKKIAAMPGTHVQVASIQTTLDEAAAMEPDYEKALAQLTYYVDLAISEHEGLSAQIQDAEAAAKKFSETAGGDGFQTLLKEARKIVADYTKIAGISDGRGIALANEKISGALKLLDRPIPDTVKATADVQEVITSLKDKTTTLTDLQKELDAVVGDVTALVGKVVDYAPVKASEDLITQQRIARALYENQQLEAAKKAWDDLKKDTKTALDKYEPIYKKWEAYNKQIEAAKTILPKAIGMPALQGPANYLQSLIERELAVVLIPLHQYAEACQLIEKEAILDGLAELQEAVFKDPNEIKFKNPQMAYRAEVKEAEAIVQDESDKILAEIQALDDLGGNRAPFDAKLKTLSELWRKTTGGTHQFNVNIVKGAMLADLQKLSAEVKTASGSGLDNSKADKKLATEAAAFETARKTAEAALKELASYNLPDDHKVMRVSPNITALRADYAKMVSDAKAGTYAHPGKLEKIATDCQGKQEQIEQDLNKIRDRAAARAKLLHEEIAKAESANKIYKKFYAELSDEVDDALGRTRSAVASLVEKGVADLEQIKLPAAADYQKVTKALADTDTLLADENLAAYQPEAQAVFKTRLSKELKPRINQLSPADAENEIHAFQDQIKLATDRAGALKLIQEDVITKAKELVKQVETLKADAPNLAKSLLARLEKVKDAPKASADKANLELATIDILFKRAKSSKPALDKLEKKTKSDEFEQKREKAAFEGSMQLFTFGIKVDAQNRYNDTPDKQRNKDTFQQMLDVSDKAQSLANDGNYAAANQELVKAVNLARYFLANPVDRKTAARKHLIRLNNEYKAAVSGYLKQLADLEAAIKTAEEDDGTGKAKKVKPDEALKALKPLFSLFGAGQFDAAVKELEKPAETLDELKVHRTFKEVALSDLRLCVKFLESNKVLAHVAGNTISPVALGPLRNALRGLEGALKAS